ncbi:MAG TPA: hypothetical protein VGH15_02665 [Caulobacteraceae bacterium]
MTTKILSGVYAAAYDLSTPITTLSVTASGYLAAGLAASGAAAYTVVNSGGIRGVYSAVSLAGGGVVTNSGVIRSTSTTKGAGVVLGNGGAVNNAAGALISGYYGVTVAVQAGSINNQGAIFGAGKFGVQLAGGGAVTNGAAANGAASIRGAIGIESTLAATVHNYGTVAGVGAAGIGGYLEAGGMVVNGSSADTTATLEGGLAGAQFVAAAGTLTNFGLIRSTGTSGLGAALEDGGVVTNGSTADTSATIEGSQYGVAFLGAAGTLTNFATVRAEGTLGKAVFLAGGGSVANGSSADTTALIESTAFGVVGGGQAVTVSNYGAIIGGYAVNLGAGIYLTKGGVVTNGSAGDVTARIGAFLGVYIKAAVGTVSNFGTIGGEDTQLGVAISYGGLIVNGSATDTTALIQGYAGVAAQKHAGTVENFGTIIAGGGPATLATSEAAVILLAGGTVVNGGSTDTKASMRGEFGVIGGGAAVTVNNFGAISGSEIGVYANKGGKVTNGSLADTSASIAGASVGVDIVATPATVINFGTIRGGPFTAAGVGMAAGGSIVNGGKTDHLALIQGFFGVQAAGQVTVNNFGTISGNSAAASIGVNLVSDGLVINNLGALIDGYTGVSAGLEATINNFGTINSLSGKSVVLTASTSRLNAEAGSVIEGVIVASSGLVDVVSGVASANAIDSSGKIEGAGTLSLAAGGSFLDAGASLLVNTIEVGAGETVNVTTKLTDAHVWDQTSGTLSVAAGDQIGFTGSANTFTGTVTGLGTVALSGGSDSLTDVTLSGGKLSISKSTVTLSGIIDLSKMVNVSTPSLIIAAGGASLTGGGTILLSNTATNSVRGASAAATLTNGDVIAGAGHLGGGTMTLVNGAGGVIESAYSNALTIDTGANTITNSGLIEAKAGGGVVIASALASTGTLETASGTLTVEGAVSGSGTLKVIGGVADFTSSFSQNVAFGASGRLVLSDSQAYGGTISGFSHTGASSLDLADIAFSGGTTATYSGTTAAGILTVSDGTHAAHIHLTGDYLTAIWTLSAATGGGTHLIDPTAPPPSIVPMISAMAGFGAAKGGGGTATTHPAPLIGSPILGRPGG